MDSSVAYIMDKVDLVLVGAEGIVENGGIINKVIEIVIVNMEGWNVSNFSGSFCIQKAFLCCFWKL